MVLFNTIFNDDLGVQIELAAWIYSIARRPAESALGHHKSRQPSIIHDVIEVRQPILILVNFLAVLLFQVLILS